ncbi:MAG TPA: GNAT family protein, partial [Vicinamibacterales bacterium]|nr:GNAT family protein [Vicinamibacterales bacterium]
GTCFAIVPNGMTTAVGILQIRAIGSTFATAEWGFVIGRHFWSTGIFYDAANLLANFAFSALHANRLEARIALRNARAHAAVQKLGARAEATIATPPRNGFQRDPQILWGLNEEDWRNRAPHRHRLSAAEATAQVRDAVRAATYALQANEPPSTVDPFPYFLFDRRRYEE